MNLLRSAALRVPAIRRLRDARDTLLAERDTLLTRAAATAQEDCEAAEARGTSALKGLIVTEYSYRPHRRPIEGAAGGSRLTARLRAEKERYAVTLRGIVRHVDSLLRIPRTQENSARPFWANDWFSLYGLIAERAPRRYIEVGSGYLLVSRDRR